MDGKDTRRNDKHSAEHEHRNKGQQGQRGGRGGGGRAGGGQGGHGENNQGQVKTAKREDKQQEGGRGGGGHSGRGGGRGRGGKQGQALPEATMEVGAAAEIAPLQAGREEQRQQNVRPYVIGSRSELEKEIQEGTVVVGELAVQKWTNAVTFVRNPGHLPKDVIVDHGADGRNGALPGDIVAVHLNPQSKWNHLEDLPGGAAQEKDKHKPILATREDGSRAKLADGRAVNRVLRQKNMATSSATAGGEESAAEAAAKPRRPAARITQECGAVPPTGWPEGRQPTAEKVVMVLERRFSRFHPCRLYDDGQDFSHIQPNRFYKFRPYDEHYPMFACYGKNIPHQFHANLTEYLFMVEVIVDESGAPVQWFNHGKFPEVKVVRSLGMKGHADAESKAIAAVCHIRDFEFPDEVEADVLKDFVIPEAEELKSMNRRDLRNEEFICTIDPATARDLDDALSCTRVGTGFRVGVHIADVSYFVPHETNLDEEAQLRSTSTYLVERVVPMLPRKLSEDYCSLNANSDKFAFSCIWDMDHDANIIGEWIGQSVIRNNCRMAYEEAQRILDGDKSGEGMAIEAHNGWSKDEVLSKVVKAVENLYRVSSKLRQKRWERGAVALNRRKMKLHFADKDSRLAPAAYSLESSIDANWVVEELMLLANCRVAEKIAQWIPDSGLVRQHSPPQKKKVTATIRAAAKFGYTLEAGNSKQLAASLERYKDSPDADVIRSMMTYCMSLAKYVSTGDDEEVPLSHFALAVNHYTHFTSPIRRYADLMVHRQLLLALEIERLVQDAAEKQGVAMDEVNFEALGLEPEDLQHGYAYTGHGKLSLMSEHMNEMKTHARLAGAMSIKCFFCYYLQALEQQSKIDRSLPTVITSAAVCTKVTKKSFTLYSRETTVEVEIFHNSQTQSWVEPNKVHEADGKFIINWGALPAGKKAPKGFKKAKTSEFRSKEEEAAKKAAEQVEGAKGANGKKLGVGMEGMPLPPGAMFAPQTQTASATPSLDDCVLEEAGLFFNCVVTFRVTQGAMIGLDFVVHPPWDRESRTGVPASLSAESAAAAAASQLAVAQKEEERVASAKTTTAGGGGGGCDGDEQRQVFEENDDE